MRELAVVALALTLAGCATDGAMAPRPAFYPVPRMSGTAVQGLMGQNATTLIQMFGTPQADVHEGSARRLQFANATCVLDTYLYPPSGHGEAVVSYLDARQTDGSPIDRASCVGAIEAARGRTTAAPAPAPTAVRRRR